MIGVAATVVGDRIFRVLPDGLVEITDRPVVVALSIVAKAAVVVGSRVLRVESDRFRVIRDGAIVIAFLEVGIATVVVGRRVLWVDPDGFAVVRNGAITVALAVVGIAAVVEGDREIVSLELVGRDHARARRDRFIARRLVAGRCVVGVRRDHADQKEKGGDKWHNGVHRVIPSGKINNLAL